MNGSLHLWLIPLLPFAGFLINGLLGKRLPKWLVTRSRCSRRWRRSAWCSMRNSLSYPPGIGE
jgi:hypothetical protein